MEANNEHLATEVVAEHSLAEHSLAELMKNMSYNFRKSISAHGHAKDELMSALQKYIRRGETKKAIYVAIELELFSHIVEARALVTNTVNRLRVCLPEELACSLTSPSTALEFDIYYQTFESNREDSSEKAIAARRAAMINMVSLLAEAPKQRLASDIKATYFVPEAKQFALASGDPVLAALYADEEFTIDDQVRGKFALVPGDHHSLATIADGILTNIKRRSDRAFYWLSLLVDATENKVPCGARRLTPKARPQPNPMHLMFELCFEYAKRGARMWDAKAEAPHAGWTRMMLDMLEIAGDYYKHFGLSKQGKAKSHRDWILFVIWPLLYCVRDVDWARNPASSVHLVSHAKATEMYEAHGKQPPLVIDDYVIDQHTARGRSLKRKGDHFAQVGAAVENADDTLFLPANRRLYEEFKKHQAQSDAATHTRKKKTIAQ